MRSHSLLMLQRRANFCPENLFRCALQQQWINKKGHEERRAVLSNYFLACEVSISIHHLVPAFENLTHTKTQRRFALNRLLQKWFLESRWEIRLKSFRVAWPNSFTSTGEHKFIYCALGKMIKKRAALSLSKKNFYIFQVKTLVSFGGVNRH